jgi:hypothetical protein
MKNQGSPAVVAFLFGGLLVAGLVALGPYLSGVVVVVAVAVLFIAITAGIAIRASALERECNETARAALAERERGEWERTKAINKQLGENSKPHRVPSIDHFGQSRPSLPSSSSANRPRLGVSRPQLDDPDVVEGEATDIPNIKGLFT